MTKLNVDFPAVPLKRYFSLDELCQLAQIETDVFVEWQNQHGIVLGKGGNTYSRQDVFLLRKLSATFQPPVDSFLQGQEGLTEQVALSAQEVSNRLAVILQRLQNYAH
ncbi:hypothetical protein [Neisseria sp. Ec49-e6-T10]|uniref:hypothetical protein n=1 Tax=Neisseria sp. Ec49-e6-T10 TaxID=3140744 RepID=UPI003EBAC117